MSCRTLQLFSLVTAVALVTGCQSSGGQSAAQLTDSFLGTRGERMGTVEYLSSGLNRVNFADLGLFYIHPEHEDYYDEMGVKHNALGQSGGSKEQIEDARCALAENYLADVPEPTHPKADSIRPWFEDARKIACAPREKRLAQARAEEEARKRRVEQEAARREAARQQAEAKKRHDAYVYSSHGYTDRICKVQADINTLESFNERELKVAARSGFINRAAMHNRATAIVYIEEQRDKERAAYKNRFGQSFSLSRCDNWNSEAAAKRQQVAGVW